TRLGEVCFVVEELSGYVEELSQGCHVANRDYTGVVVDPGSAILVSIRAPQNNVDGYRLASTAAWCAAADFCPVSVPLEE
ncbi:hypothetical protein GS901_27070, partial [Rhodococcus hoagii]|nr:hypothetical protein [Prescottella equi]